jgi:excisionase family DNA binding protein
MTEEQLALPAGVTSTADLGTTYSLTAAASLLGVSVKTVQRMVKRGDLPGSHKAPMENGKGEQWRVPLSALYEHQNKTRAAAPAPDPTITELQELRDKVAKLETELREQRSLADERRHELEQLHLTFRTALTAGSPGTSSQSRWWKRKTKHA